MKQDLIIPLKLKFDFLNEADFSFYTIPFTKLCNYVSKWIFEHNCTTNFSFIQRNTQKQLCNKFNAESKDVNNIIKYVINRYKECQYNRSLVLDSSRIKRPLYFKNQQYYFEPEKWRYVEDGTETYLWLQFPGAKLKKMCYRIRKQYANAKYKFAILEKRSNEWLFYIHASITTSDIARSKAQKVIIDFSDLSVYCTKNEKKRKFGSGNDFKKADQYDYLYRRLKNLDTKSSRRKARKVSLKRKRWLNNQIHSISKKIVNFYGSNIVYIYKENSFSDLSSNIKEYIKKEDYIWIVSRLVQDLTYKASLSQSKVEIQWCVLK